MFWINMYTDPQSYCRGRGYLFGYATGATRWSSFGIQQKQVICYDVRLN